MKLNKKIGISSIIFLALILNTGLSSIFLTPATTISDQTPQDEKFNENLPKMSTDGENDWWNDSFRYRRKISITEPGIFNRVNEPIDIFLEFDSGKCHKDTLRVEKYKTGDIWEEQIYQLWNITMYDSTYIQSCTITFLVSINKSQNVSYFIYYSDNTDNGKIKNPHNEYISKSGFSSELTSSKLKIKTTEYELELKKNSGVFNLTKSGLNFHQNNSLAPWIKNARLDNNIYHPDPSYGGAIYSWLIVGPFNLDWDHPITDTDYHLDITKQYVEGDNATGGTAPESFLDESKQWAFKDFSSYSDYNSYRGYNDLNSYFPGDPNYVCAYASVYIRSPVTLNSVYLKVGSDDGIRIWKDGVKIHENHVLRGPSPDREAIGPFTMEKGRWYYFIVLVEEKSGDFGFNFRFSNNSNLYPSDPSSDPDSILNLDVAMRPPLPVIQSITEKINGPIFSKYELSWQDSDDMKTWDTITFYNDYNLWKVERTLWWADHHVNLSFSVLNSLYDNNANHFDSYFYDNTWKTSITDTSFTIENYSVIRDTDGSKNLMSLGIFISSKEKGNPYMTFSKFYWAVDYDSSTKIINFRPGFETDLNNKGSHTFPADFDYNIKITFWEYIDDNVGAINDYLSANANFSGLYNALKNPLILNIGEIESSFFDLTVNVRDHDGNKVENVKVYVYNISSLNEIASQYTNEDGFVTFNRLPAYNYTLNFTYTDDQGEFIVKSNVIINLNETLNITVSDLNLTRLNLNLVREGGTEKIVGANVEFWYINSSGKREYKIRSLTSDDQGNVLFIWKNVSQSIANISVHVILLGAQRLLNTTSYYLNYTFEHETNGKIRVQIEPYSTGLERLNPSSSVLDDLYKGDLINLKVRYYWVNESNSLETNISDATITYTIKDTTTGVIISSGIFNDDIFPIGYYNVSINTGELNLLSKRPYQIIISAEKTGYAIKTDTITLNLLEIWTNLTVDKTEIDIAWGENFTIRASYNDTLNRNIGLSGASVSYSVAGTLSGDLIEDSFHPGWYNLTLNSDQFPQTGIYVLSITAYKEGYKFQEVFVNVNISYISTSLNINVSMIETIWEDNFSIELNYINMEDSLPISDAKIVYQALGTITPVQGSFIDVGNGTYIITLNTTQFSYTGFYFLKIEASKTNYQSHTIEIPINIFPISTLINNTVGIYDSYNVIIGTSKIFYFNYTIAETGIILPNSTTRICEWERRDQSGNLIESGTLSLSYTKNGLYRLDFNTETREIGTYTLVISIGETNYAEKTIILILNIVPRSFNIILEKEKFSNGIISIVSGNALEFSIELRDQTNNKTLNDCNVSMLFLGKQYNFTNEGNGTYSIIISSLPDAFFSSLQYKAIITIERANFTDTEQAIFVVVNMAEIFPGMPTFYFLMIVGSIVAVVGSLITYRTVQRARIPTFIKKVSKIRKLIKSRKNIPDSLLYPTKEEYIVKMFEDKWNMLGLSLKDVLGLELKKKRKSNEKLSMEEGEA